MSTSKSKKPIGKTAVSTASKSASAKKPPAKVATKPSSTKLSQTTKTKAIAKPTYKNHTILSETLVQTNHFTPTITHDKPIAIGVSILELVRKT